MRRLAQLVDVRDVLSLGGVVLVSVGVGLVWTLGAGLIAFGLGVFYLGALHGVVFLRSLPRNTD